MTTQLLGRVEAEARQVRLGRALLTAILAIFWAIGWLAGMVSVAVGFAWASVKVGWQDARDQKAGPHGRAP